MTFSFAGQEMPLGTILRLDLETGEHFPDVVEFVDANGARRPVMDIIGSDQGDAPCSRYGVRFEEWAPIAVVACDAWTCAAGELLTEDGVKGIVSLVVNDSDDVAILLEEHGTDPAVSLLEPGVRELAREQLAADLS